MPGCYVPQILRRLDAVALHLPVLLLLLVPAPAAFAQPNLYDWSESPLYDAVTLDSDLEAVLRVGKVRKKPDWRDARGATALMYAASISRIDLVEQLMARGADVDARDKAGQTAFHYACGSMLGASFPSPDAIRFLARVGADVNAVDNEGLSGLHHTVSSITTAPEGVEAALDAGVDTELLTKGGFSALALAREHGRQELAELISAAGGSATAPAPSAGPAEAPAEPAPAELETPPLAGLALPLELSMWVPELADDEEEWEDEGAIELRVRLSAMRAAAESPECAARRADFRAGWADEVAPAVRMAGNQRFSYFGDGLEQGWHLEVDETWDGEVTLKSSLAGAESSDASLCLIGAGTGEWAGSGYTGLHFGEDETSDLVLVLFAGKLTPEARTRLEGELGYPATEPDPRGLLLTINEAGGFPAVLRQGSG